jgi:hypothetical protein
MTPAMTQSQNKIILPTKNNIIIQNGGLAMGVPSYGTLS